MARKTSDGKEAFRVALPRGNFSTYPLAEVAGLFVAQGTTWPDTPNALLIDRTGKVYHQFDSIVLGVTAVGEDRLVLTGREVARLGDGGEVRWTAPSFGADGSCEGGLITLADGSLVGYRYREITDSGVKLIRIDSDSGQKRWEAYCDPVGVSHSKYRHQAMVVADGGRLKVTSRGSYGSFVEVLDAPTGRSLGRKQDKGGD